MKIDQSKRREDRIIRNGTDRHIRSFIYFEEFLIGKKRSEVSFGFNEHQSYKRVMRPAVYILPQGFSFFSEENLFKESVCITRERKER